MNESIALCTRASSILSKRHDCYATFCKFTVWALRLTLRHFLIASKIAAKLSMLGLPFGDSILWRLLLGVAVTLRTTTRRGDISQMHNPCHPGEVLKEALSEISVTDAAKRLGVGRVALSRLLNGATGISPEMALRLSKSATILSLHWDPWRQPLPSPIRVFRRPPRVHGCPSSTA
jgi:addiction module HigA family antidote